MEVCCKAANGSKSKHWSVCFNAQNLTLNWQMRRKIYKYVNFISCEYLMPCRLNKTKWRVSGFKNGKFKSSWQKRPSCFSNVMASEVGAEDWKKFGGVMGVFVKSIGHVSK